MHYRFINNYNLKTKRMYYRVKYLRILFKRYRLYLRRLFDFVEFLKFLNYKLSKMLYIMFEINNFISTYKNV